MVERKPGPVESTDNGGAPHYVLVREGGGHLTFGPYTKTFAEHLCEVFGDTVEGSEPSIIAEIVEITRD